MSGKLRFVLVGLIVPLSITGLVCWLTPWLAVPEAFLYDRFLRTRPVTSPPGKMLVVLWDDGGRSSQKGAKVVSGGARQSEEVLRQGLRRMAEAGPALVAVSGELVETLPQVLGSRSPSISSDREVAVVSLAEDPAGTRMPVGDRYADALLLWWNDQQAWGDAVYLRRLLMDTEEATAEEKASPGSSSRGENPPSSLAISPGKRVLIAALRPLPSLPLWSGEHLQATNWYGPPGTFSTVSMRQIAEGEVSQQRLAGAVVVLGRRQDLRITPMGPMSCAEAHANLLLTALQNRWIVPLPPWWHWLILFVVAALAATVVASTSGVMALTVILFEIASVGMVARGALQTDQWFCCTPALAAIGLSAFSALVISLGFSRLDESRLTREMKLRDELLSAIAHDLRQPLTLVSVYVERIAMALEKGKVESLDTRVLEGILQALRSMDSELDRMLFANPDRPLHLRPEPVSAWALVRDAMNELGRAAQSHQIVVEGQDVIFEGDARAVKNALLCLLRNAVRYSPRDTKVTVRVEDAGDEVRLVVSDQGPGIPRSQRLRIFERFARAVPEEAKIPGMGLGLYVVKRIAEAHGGRVEVDSEVGQGSTFTLVLPKKQTEPQEAKSATAALSAVLARTRQAGH